VDTVSKFVPAAEFPQSVSTNQEQGLMGIFVSFCANIRVWEGKDLNIMDN
jgi:hypothetical protein